MKRAYDTRSGKTQELLPGIVSHDERGDALGSYGDRITIMRALYAKGQQAKCRVIPLFRDLEVLKSDSASNILLVLAKFGPLPHRPGTAGVAVKFSFASCDPQDDNSQETEKKVYQHFIAPFVMDNVTPHLFLPLAMVQCGDFTDIIKAISDEKTRSAMRRRFYTMVLLQMNNELGFEDSELRYWDETDRTMARDVFQGTFEQYQKKARERNAALNALALRHLKKKTCTTRMDMLVMERANGPPLATVLTNYYYAKMKLPWTIAGPILFQTLYTLLCFQRIGLMHNDLHMKNIFADQYTKPQKHTYAIMVRGKPALFTLKTIQFARIFDFDRASKVATSENAAKMHNTYIVPYLCETYGQCNKFTYFFDAHGILLNLYFIFIAGRLDGNGGKFFEALRQRMPKVTTEMDNFIRNLMQRGDATQIEQAKRYGLWRVGYFEHLWCYKDKSDSPCTMTSFGPETLPDVLAVLGESSFPHDGLPEVTYREPLLQE